MNKTEEQYQNDEIDLLEVLRSLWTNKILILVITTFFSIVGLTYAFLAPELWSAKAVIVTPQATKLEHLQLRLDNFVVLMAIPSDSRNSSDNMHKKKGSNSSDNNDNSDSRNINNHSIFFESFSKEKLYSDFVQSFNSFDNKNDFLHIQGYSQNHESNKTETSLHATKKLKTNISANNISAKSGRKDQFLTTLSFSSDNAEEAQRLLIEYINFIQSKELKAKNEILTDKITNQTNLLTLTYQIQEKAAIKKLQDDILRTQYALRISRTAGIEAPVENLNNQGMFVIDLGAKALSEKLKILKEIKQYELINPVLADTRLQLNSLGAIPKDKVRFSSYHYLQSPSYPQKQDKPRRFLVIIMSTLAGLLVGGIAALLKVSFSFKAGKKY